MDIRGFHHLAIQVNDLERTAAFYRDALGLRERTRHRRDDGSLRSVWLELPDGGFLALEQVGGEPAEEAFRHGRPGLFLVALGICREDRHRIVAELGRKGIPVVHQTRWTVYVRDPEGNRVGLSHYPQDPLPDE